MWPRQWRFAKRVNLHGKATGARRYYTCWRAFLGEAIAHLGAVFQEQACGFNMKCNWIALDRSARMVEGRKSFRFNSSTANSRAAPMARCLL